MKRRGRIGIGSLLAVSIVLLTLACGDDKGTDSCVGTSGGAISLPLAEGASWVYTMTQTQLGDTDTYERVDRVTGTEPIEGETYAEIRSILTAQGSSQADTSYSYLRQTGQLLFAHELADTAGMGDDEVNQFIFGSILGSMPWQVADFASTSCDSWTLTDVEKDFSLDGGGQLKAEVKITGSNEGRTDITVPGGSYQDVYIAKFVVEASVVANMPPLPPIQSREVVTQRLYIANDVGVVRDETESRFTETGNSPVMTTSVAELVSYVPAN